MPVVGDRCIPGSKVHQLSGTVLGPLQRRVVVPVPGPRSSMTVGVIDADSLHGQRLDTFDPTVHWMRVSGPLHGEFVDASDAWRCAVAAAYRALGSELITISEQILAIAVDHAKTRVQFGTPIGSFQSPRHALAEACAALEGLAPFWANPGATVDNSRRRPPRLPRAAHTGRCPAPRCKYWVRSGSPRNTTYIATSAGDSSLTHSSAPTTNSNRCLPSSSSTPIRPARHPPAIVACG